MAENDIAGIELTSGPTHLRSRIFVRNLPPCTRQELAMLCVPFGKILGSLVVQNHGFVQFERESEAKSAIEALNHATFQSKVILVSSASFRSLKAAHCMYSPSPKRRMLEWNEDDISTDEYESENDDEEDGEEAG
ncbi:uncharacterized protein Dere_GG12822, partial [Drosophila erecta]